MAGGQCSADSRHDFLFSPGFVHWTGTFMWGGFFGGKEGEGGRKVSKPRPFGVFRASGRGLTFVCQS